MELWKSSYMVAQRNGGKMETERRKLEVEAGGLREMLGQWREEKEVGGWVGGLVGGFGWEGRKLMPSGMSWNRINNCSQRCY